MTRKDLEEYIDLEYIILDSPEYDSAIVGYEDNTDSARLVYDFNKMVLQFMQDNNCDEMEAIEFIEYNTLRALPYMGDSKPIIIHMLPEEIEREV